MKPRSIQVVWVCATLICSSCHALADTKEHKATKSSADQWVINELQHMSLEEKIGQMLQVRIYTDFADLNSPELLFLKSKLQQYHIGSVDIAARMSGPNLLKGSPEQVAAILNDLQRNSKVPLLVGADIERGLASRVSNVPEFPFPMALSAINDAKIVRRFGAITGSQARAVGIQWAFAPVADINSNPENPIINNRSFGEDAKQVGEMVAAYIDGAHSSNLLVAVKHFPGHGETSSDSHFGIVTIGGDRKHLEQNELVPFNAAIHAGADSFMLAHAVVPALDPDTTRISTTSPKIVNGLLRNEMGFRGVVLTDALEMRGLLNLYASDPNPTGRVSVEAIKAGADVLMMPLDLDAAFNAIVKAVRDRDIPEARIDESVKRILSLKAKAHLNESKVVDVAEVRRLFANKDTYEFAQEVSDRSVTLVRSNARVLPLIPSKSVAGAGLKPTGPPLASKLVVVSFTDSRYSRLGPEFDRQIMLRRPDARIFHYYNDNIGSDDSTEMTAQVKAADQVVIAAFVTHVPRKSEDGRIMNTVGLSGANAEFLARIVATNTPNTVVIALGSPYLIANYPKIENYICTYSLASTAEITAVKALFGEIQNTATLPVTLPGVAKRGFSIPWPTVPIPVNSINTVVHQNPVGQRIP
jgi:beta-N-acetylhexosaminidase